MQKVQFDKLLSRGSQIETIAWSQEKIEKKIVWRFWMMLVMMEIWIQIINTKFKKVKPQVLKCQPLTVVVPSIVWCILCCCKNHHWPALIQPCFTLVPAQIHANNLFSYFWRGMTLIQGPTLHHFTSQVLMRVVLCWETIAVPYITTLSVEDCDRRLVTMEAWSKAVHTGFWIKILRG